jgi:hypothetical protein
MGRYTPAALSLKSQDNILLVSVKDMYKNQSGIEAMCLVIFITTRCHVAHWQSCN